jgi:hypothetical protein
MKKTFIISLIFLAAIVIMAFTHSGENPWLLKNTSGPPAGYAGDPAGGNRNCTFCHTGNPAAFEAGWITSNIPAGGYIPGETYTITATAVGTSISKFGFQISPQSTSGEFRGTILNTGTQTQISGNQRYIHQTLSGTVGSGTKTWTFDWIAPEAGSGSVTFFGAFNLTNSGNNSSGDLIKLSTLAVDKDITADIQSNYVINELKVFPNPSSHYLSIHSNTLLQQIKYNIIDMSGTIVYTGELLSSQTIVDISVLSAGIYFFHIPKANEEIVRFIKH